MAAIMPSDKPYLKTGVLETFKAREPWLMILMLSATFTGLIMTHFENALVACTILTSFTPMLSGTGGNSGTQASTAVIRALSLGEVRFRDTFRVIWKEARVALLCGLMLAGANFIKMMLVDRWMMHNPAVTVAVAAVVCATLVCTVLCAKVVGCSLPILAENWALTPLSWPVLYLYRSGCHFPAGLFPNCHRRAAYITESTSLLAKPYNFLCKSVSQSRQLFPFFPQNLPLFPQKRHCSQNVHVFFKIRSTFSRPGMVSYGCRQEVTKKFFLFLTLS